MSLADLRANPPTEARQEEPFDLVLRPDIAERVRELQVELADLPEPVEKPRKLSQSKAEVIEHPRVVEIREQMQALMAEAEAASGTLVVRANLTDGEWVRWASENPPRDPEKDRAGAMRDLRVTKGLVNVDALVADLGRFAWTWNGDRLVDGDWERIFANSVIHGDKLRMAERIVGFYEGRQDFPSWRRALSDALTKWSAGEPPEGSGSPTSDSTAGSPALSSEG